MSTTEPTITVPPPVRQPAYDAIYALIRSLGDHMPASPINRNALIWRAVETALDALDEQGRLLPAATDVRVEYAAWCHGEDRNGIRLTGEGFTSPHPAGEWAEKQFGRYGITGYRVMRREHHIFPDGSRYATAIIEWVEDAEPVDALDAAGTAPAAGGEADR